MTWVAVAIGGSAVIGAGTNIGMGFLGSGAAGEAAEFQKNAYLSAEDRLSATTERLLALYNPFISAGVGATGALQADVTNPDEIATQRKIQRESLLMQNPGLGAVVRSPEEEGRLNSAVSAWQQRLNSFDRETKLLMQQATQRAKTGAASITESPIYKYQAELTNRALASQGLLGSQRAIAEQGNIAANAYGNRQAILSGLAGRGVQAAGAASGAIVPLTQTIGGFQVGAGEAGAAGIIGSANAISGGVAGGVNSLVGGGQALLNYNLYSKMIGQLNTGGNGSHGWDPVMGTGTPPNTQLSQRQSLLNTYGMTE